MGSADEKLGIFLSIILYLLALLCVSRSSPSKLGLIALAPLAAPLWIQASFAARFGFAYFVQDASICTFSEHSDAGGYEYDGREYLIWLLWTIAPIIASLVFFVSIRKAFR